MSLNGNIKSGGVIYGNVFAPEVIRGKSAYEIAVILGFKGTEAEWIESLNGTDGKDGADGLTPYIKEGRWWIGDTDTGVSAANPDSELSPESINAVQNKVITAELEKINEQIADILYKPITIDSFTVSPSSAEIGSTVNSVALMWALNKVPTSLTLDGEAQPAGANGGAELINLAITANKAWALKATDERGATAEKTASLTFLNGVYYGVKAAPGEYDSAFILGLTKNLRSSKLTSISVNAGDGQYIYYCLPKRFGTCSFTVGGFSGGFSLVETIQFENASGYTEDYYIYKSDNAGLGSTKVTIA